MASQRRRKYNLSITLEKELYVNMPGMLVHLTPVQIRNDRSTNYTAVKLVTVWVMMKVEKKVRNGSRRWKKMPVLLEYSFSSPYIINPNEMFEYYFPPAGVPHPNPTLMYPNQVPPVPSNALMTRGFPLKCSDNYLSRAHLVD
ncbi:hypothetical protein GWK47_001927 [Chionoecetes opilio]|uniref:Uncharacterized protein n=1 Tax=Chionoecetes opilio TaxID=41210 RepID=A0A8J4XRA0_CHIOP|nr:hypothetical protein GWK47_001927 [Chionoecetes opilio]